MGVMMYLDNDDGNANESFNLKCIGGMIRAVRAMYDCDCIYTMQYPIVHDTAGLRAVPVLFITTAVTAVFLRLRFSVRRTVQLVHIAVDEIRQATPVGVLRHHAGVRLAIPVLVTVPAVLVPANAFSRDDNVVYKLRPCLSTLLRRDRAQLTA